MSETKIVANRLDPSATFSLSVNQFGDGTVTSPSITFAADTNTGMFRNAADTIGLATNGLNRLNISTTELTMTLQIQSVDGTVSAPQYSFANDPDTGIYRSTSNSINFAAGGLQSLQLTADAVYPFFHIRNINGTVGNPSYSFDNSTAMGMYLIGTNILGFTTNSTERMRIDATGNVGIGCTPSNALDVNTGQVSIDVGGGSGTALTQLSLQFGVGGALTSYRHNFKTHHSTTAALNRVEFWSATNSTTETHVFDYNGANQVLFSDGTPSAPSMSFISDTDTGINRAGANTINFATNGANRMSLDVTSLTVNLPIYLSAGSAAAPSYSFGSFTNTGIFNNGTNSFRVAVNGTQMFSIDTSTINLESNALMNTTGTAATPSVAFAGDADTGIYHSATNQIALSSGGAVALLCDPTAINMYTNGSLRWQMDGNLTASGTGKLYVSDGSAAVPAISFTNDTDTGIFRTGANAFQLVCGGVAAMNIAVGGNLLIPAAAGDFSTNRILPNADNTYNLGSAGARWGTVFAATGTINTSHSSTKSNIVELDWQRIDIPQGVEYDRDGRRHMGYLNDCLPDVARPFNEDGTISRRDNYENAVIGILCSVVKGLRDEVTALKEKLGA